jgi:hypothetical protein
LPEATKQGLVDQVRLLKYVWGLLRDVLEGVLAFRDARRRIAQRAVSFLRPVRARAPATAPELTKTAENQLT